MISVEERIDWEKLFPLLLNQLSVEQKIWLWLYLSGHRIIDIGRLLGGDYNTSKYIKWNIIRKGRMLLYTMGW